MDKEKPKYVAKLGKDGGSPLDVGSAKSPMPGVLDRMLVKVGDKVKKGDSLFVIIAMKMEYVVKAAKDGVVAEVAKYNVGDSVAKNTELVKFEEEASAAAPSS